MELRELGRGVFETLIPDRHQHRTRERIKGTLSTAKLLLRNRGRDLPAGIEFETNARCNRACYYCPRPENSSTVLDERVLESVLQELEEWGFKGHVALHSYNEPLTDRRIFDLYSMVSNHLPQSELELRTNGDALDREKIESAIESGVTRIVITLHDPISPEKVDKARNFSAEYDLVRVHDLRKGYRTLGFHNRAGLVQLSGTVPRIYCHIVDTPVIRSDGSVVPCCDDAQKETVLGNVNETGFREIWESYAALRRQIHRGKSPLEMCANCSYQRCNDPMADN